jgi:hypothetical protein
MSSFEGINRYYRDKLAAERSAYAEAEQQAQLEGTSGDVVWLRWKHEAQAEERRASGLAPTQGLNHAQQQSAAGRVPAIAERARAQREGTAAPPVPIADWQDSFIARHGRWPTTEEHVAAGYLK